MLQLIDSSRFMTSSLSNLANNFSKGIHRIKCKLDKMIKNMSHVKLNISIVTVFLNSQILMDNLIEYKCLCCNINYPIKY